MSKEKNSVRAYNLISFFVGVGVTLAALRLCGVLDWSWWLVTMPFWVPVALFVALVALLLVASLGYAIIKVFVMDKEDHHER